MSRETTSPKHVIREHHQINPKSLLNLQKTSVKITLYCVLTLAIIQVMKSGL